MTKLPVPRKALSTPNSLKRNSGGLFTIRDDENENLEDNTIMITSWLTLVPPLAVLFLALITKKIVPALLSGIVVAALIVSHWAPLAAVELVATKVYGVATDIDNLLMFGFLPVLGTLIMLVKHTGGAQAWVHLISKKVHTKKRVELATLGFSSLFFMDDYFNTWTVGPVMHPLTDRYGIARAKLAFFINMLAPSLAIIFPVSSWVAVILGQMEQSGISTQPNALIKSDAFSMLLQVIPFMFYPIIAIALTWFIVAVGISFGPMKEQEDIATEAHHEMLVPAGKGTVWDFIVPLGVLMILSPSVILATGGYWLFGGSYSFPDALSHANIFKALLLSSGTTLLFTTIYYSVMGKLTVRDFLTLAKEGTTMMTSSITLLFLAFVFGSFLRTDLPAGNFLATTGIASLPLPLLPFIFYAIAAFSASAVGSAWGTIMVFFPVAVPMFVTLYHATPPAIAAYLPLLAPTLGAILSGAVVGAQVSPIADNVITSSLATDTNVLLHVKTQIPYIIPGIIATGISYLISGFMVPTMPLLGWLVSLVTGLALTFGMLLVLNGRKIK